MNETSGCLHIDLLFAEFPGLKVVENVSPEEFRKLIDVEEFVICSNWCSMPMVYTTGRLHLPLEVKLGERMQAETGAQ